jgi:hypothetical protein
MSTLLAVFTMVVVVSALGFGIAVWWMAVSPTYRPNTSNTGGRSGRLMTKMLLGLLVLVLVIFGPVAQLMGMI